MNVFGLMIDILFDTGTFDLVYLSNCINLYLINREY